MKPAPKVPPALTGLTVVVVVALAWCAAGCRSHPAGPGIDRGAAACIPAGTVVVASLDLDRLRVSPLYRRLPPAAIALAESYRTAQHLLAAWNGADVLIAAQGPFREAPPGATLAARNLALSGAPGAVRAALAQYRSGSTGVPGMLGYAAKTADGSPIWVVVQGGVALPLTGNVRNLNRLFHNLEYAALSVDLASPVNLSVTFTLVDTGGIGLLRREKAGDVIIKAAMEQVELAVEAANVIILVVNVQEGVVPLDREVAERLRRSGKPVLVAANKADNNRAEKDADVFAELAFEKIFPVSAIHGRSGRPHGNCDRSIAWSR